MTAQLPISKEQLLADIAHAEEKAATLCGPCADDHARLAGYLRALLAAHEQEPVSGTTIQHVSDLYAITVPGCEEEYFTTDAAEASRCVKKGLAVREYVKLERLQAAYTHPAPVPAVAMPEDLHPDTKKLVGDFANALAEKLYKAQLKYGYDADWKQDGWPTQCQAHFHQHIAKGDPRDVAAYCAFMWYHGWKTETQAPVPSVPAKWPEKLTWSHHDDMTQAEVLAWNNAIDACRSALVPVPAVPELVSIIGELTSAIRSINRAPHHIAKGVDDDEPCYLQRKEWIDWILDLASSADEKSRAAMLNGGKS